MRLRSLIVALVLSSCSSYVPIPSSVYEVYVLRTDEMKLNARDPKNDLPISACSDSLESKANCYVFRRDEYSKMKKDMVELSIRLQACEIQE